MAPNPWLIRSFSDDEPLMGGADFDATTVDASTVELEGMAVRAVGKKNKLLAHTEDVNGDGFDDLVAKIEDTDGASVPGETEATLTGALFDGMPIEGADTIRIVQ